MVMQQALRPYVTAGVALVGASLIAVTPVTAPSPGVPHVYLPAIQLTAGDPNAAIESLLSTLDSNLNSDLSTLEIDVTNGFSTLESDLTGGLSGLGSLSGLDSDLVSGFSALESDVTSGFTTLTEALIGYPNDIAGTNSLEDWLVRIHDDLDGPSTFASNIADMDTILHSIYGELFDGVGYLSEIASNTA
jgi:hypothetical protein